MAEGKDSRQVTLTTGSGNVGATTYSYGEISVVSSLNLYDVIYCSTFASVDLI